MLLAGAPDRQHTAPAPPAAPAAEHVTALLPELGERRLREGVERSARAVTA
ncbi:hypothetical protein [Kitasatospora sp. CB02891]|uniref:hypothetical protein n=1 Tax=Kitasatospora sp. CB02891 TaxID=2020329 RepID=UPI001E30560F|nr:hypothetical protein [Kitasatospora sp. CB02891]